MPSNPETLSTQELVVGSLSWVSKFLFFLCGKIWLFRWNLWKIYGNLWYDMDIYEIYGIRVWMDVLNLDGHLDKKKHWKGTSIARFVYQREQLNNTKDAGEMIDGIGLWWESLIHMLICWDLEHLMSRLLFRDSWFAPASHAKDFLQMSSVRRQLLRPFAQSELNVVHALGSGQTSDWNNRHGNHKILMGFGICEFWCLDTRLMKGCLKRSMSTRMNEPWLIH